MNIKLRLQPGYKNFVYFVVKTVTLQSIVTGWDGNSTIKGTHIHEGKNIFFVCKVTNVIYKVDRKLRKTVTGSLQNVRRIRGNGRPKRLKSKYFRNSVGQRYKLAAVYDFALVRVSLLSLVRVRSKPFYITRILDIFLRECSSEDFVSRGLMKLSLR